VSAPPARPPADGLDHGPTDAPAVALRDRFGLEEFRPGQRGVIEAVLDRRDVLCVMPTGGGKSLCYQLPALLLDGLTLVVSPLIALMKDQVDALKARGLSAALINSTLEPAEQMARLAEAEAGRFDLLYVAPERFRSGRFVEAMARVKPALLAVDEAHCISEWGHDFRPDYARLGLARRRLGSPPCIALTATATDLVRRDIADQLDLRDPAIFVTGFDRPNLSYAVVEARKEEQKLRALADVLGRAPGPAIVYASSRKRCEEVARFIESDLRRPAVVYHAGLARDDRHAAHERFMGGDAGVVVATNAFGMGVDKADVRSVIHYNLPGTLEAYYQEAGRAGRDGKPARCVLLYAPGDRFLQEMFIENEYPPREAVDRIYDFLRGRDDDPIELTQAEIKDALGLELNESAVGAALKILEGAGAIERFPPRENMALIRLNADPGDPPLADRVGAQAHVQRLVAIALEGLVGSRRGEPVYFRPDELANALGLERSALNRAIRELVDRLPIDYVPPFRGVATRVADRSKPARRLEIDFASLHKRRDQEYGKLERMIHYAQAKSCRRAFVLSYFGDAEAARTHCGRCDNCGDGDPSAAATARPVRPIDTEAGREVILMVLSGVARAKGGFGKGAVAQMLAGSGSEKMERTGLARLSTYGLLGKNGFNKAEAERLIESMAMAGQIESRLVERSRPVIELSEAGWARLRGQAVDDLTLDLDESLVDKVRRGGLERRSASRADPPEIEADDPPPAAEPRPAADEALLTHLRALRARWARDAGLSAGYVFTNETLEILARERPSTPPALARVKGIGPSKLERYGAELLEAFRAAPPIAEAAVEPSSTALRVLPATPVVDAPVPPAREPAPRVAPPAAPLNSPVAAIPTPREATPARPTSSYVPTEEWTGRLLDRGFTLAEAAAIRGLEPSAILRHALLLVRRGRAIDPAGFVPAGALREWDAWLADRGADAPPPGVDADSWSLFVACRRPSG